MPVVRRSAVLHGVILSAVECFEPDTCVNIVVTGICRLRLRRLDFSCNRIAHIPCDVRKVDTLEELCVNNNPLLSPPAAVSFTCQAACFTWQMRVVCQMEIFTFLTLTKSYFCHSTS